MVTTLRPIYRTPEKVETYLAALLQTIGRRAQTTVDFIVAPNARLSRELDYVIRMEPGVQAPETTLCNGKGS